MFVIDAYSILIFVSASVVASLATVIFLGSKKLSSRLFAFTLMITVIWMVGVGLLKSSAGENLAELFVPLTYYLGGLIAAGFFYFCLTFPMDEKPKRWVAPLIILIEVLFIPIYYNGLISYDAFYIGGIQNWSWHFGPLWFLFDIFFNGFFILGLTNLYRKYLSWPEGTDKTNLKFMFWSMVVALIPASIVNIILPRLGYQELNWFGPVSSLAWVSIFSYSIFRYRQMDVKAIAAEVFVLVMSIVLLGNVFIGATLGAIGRSFIFLAFTLIGYFFIRSILKESEQKDKLKKLNDQLNDFNHNLQQKVDEQTKEVKQAYEVEKKARIELEDLNKAKDQFVLATQHHLRTPLTIVRGYMESLYKDVSDGNVDNMTLESIKKASLAADRLNHLVNELLSISQMETGAAVLRKTPTDINAVIQSVLGEIKEEIEKNKVQININLPKDVKGRTLNVDADKMKEALWNILDNAVKYNKANGSVSVTGEEVSHPIERDKKVFRLIIDDTGMGITKEELPKLFFMYFERGKIAEEINATGRGIGLVVTKNIINAHGGRIWAESEGDGKGSRFVIELPIS